MVLGPGEFEKLRVGMSLHWVTVHNMVTLSLRCIVNSSARSVSLSLSKHGI